MLTAVLFDLDDTLFDHRHCTHAALQALRARSAHLALWPEQELYARHSAILEELHLDVLAGRLSVDEARVRRFLRLFADAGAPQLPDEAAASAAAYREAYLGAWRLVPGALPLLKTLRSRVRIGVVTNNLVSEQQRKVRTLGLGSYVDALVISEAVGVNKPEARIFEIALERLGAAAADAAMVGDSWATDIEGARAAGIRAIWFNPQRRERPEPADVRELESLEPAAHAAAIILGAA